MGRRGSILLIISALFGLLSVLLGAFGAHALHEPLVRAGKLEVWKTATNYQFFHALALGFLAVLVETCPMNWAFRLMGPCWALGILCFSGSLYWLALGGPQWLGPVTPVGGFLLMFGWLLLGLFGVIGLKSSEK